VSAAEEVVTADRVEVLDGQGRPKVVLTGTGIHLLDGEGHDRASLTMEPGGPRLVMRSRLRDVLALSVVDESPDGGFSGCRLVLCDGRGQARAGWQVADDGTVESFEVDADGRG